MKYSVKNQLSIYLSLKKNKKNNEDYLYSTKEPNERHSWRIIYQLFLHTNTRMHAHTHIHTGRAIFDQCHGKSVQVVSCQNLYDLFAAGKVVSGNLHNVSMTVTVFKSSHRQVCSPACFLLFWVVFCFVLITT